MTPIDTQFSESKYQELFKKLVSYLKKIDIPHEDAENIVQDLFLKMSEELENKPQLSAKLSNEGYWYISARNKGVDYLRAKGKFDAFVKRYSKRTGGMDVFDWFEKCNELEYDLKKEIRSLSPQQQAIFLAYLADKAIPEIAEDLNTSPRNVRNQISKGIKALKEKLHLSLLLHHFWEILSSLFTLFLLLWEFLHHL